MNSIETNPRVLSKACIDVGYFTNNPHDTLAFWRDEIGLDCEQPVEFNDGLTQYRHALGDSVVKINTARKALACEACGYSELIIAREGLSAPRRLSDPDGNRLVLVPPGHDGVNGLGLRVTVADAALQHAFYCDAMGFTEHGAARFGVGDSIIIVDEQRSAPRAGHWVNAGLRYFTLHVMRVDACFQTVVAAGAAIGEQPYSIGRIARISFVRDPHGNWIEVAQRASLAGPWWNAQNAGQ